MRHYGCPQVRIEEQIGQTELAEIGRPDRLADGGAKDEAPPPHPRGPGQGGGSAAPAASRSLSSMDRLRIETAASIVGTGTFSSSALSDVHMPVPFWMATSRISSISRRPVSASRSEKIFPAISTR